MNITNYVCETLCINASELLAFAKTSPYRYKQYQIAKRNSSEKRTIAHPAKELKFIQKVILTKFTDELPIHPSAFAYRKGLGIRENALQHINNKYLLKLDFKNFFPSITPIMFFDTLKKFGLYNQSDEEMLTGILFWRPERKGNLHLSIGAPTSPIISNFIMYEFDDIISKHCLSSSIKYSRYADDLTFSTNKKDVLFTLPEIVSKLIKDLFYDSLVINNQKTIFSSKAHNRHVTGITITNDNKLSLGRNRKRLISSMIHRYTLNNLAIDEIYKLHGLLSYAIHIDSSIRSQMVNKYGLETIENLLHLSQLTKT